MDECESKNGVVSGTYRLIPVTGPEFAKMDEYFVEMRVLSRTEPDQRLIAKR
jgi:hypothetical protein